MLHRRALIGGLALSVVMFLIATRGLEAQSPEPVVTPVPSETRPTAVPSDPAATLTINATLRLEVSPTGEFQRIPEGSKLQVLVGEGNVCLEFDLPANAIQTLEATRTLRLPPLTIPLRAVNARCPAEGDSFGIVIASPEGRTTVLLTSIWSPGTVNIDLTIPAPTAIPGVPRPQLPTTGDGGGGADVGWLYLAAAMLFVALGAHTLSRVVSKRRSR